MARSEEHIHFYVDSCWPIALWKSCANAHSHQQSVSAYWFFNQLKIKKDLSRLIGNVLKDDEHGLHIMEMTLTLIPLDYDPLHNLQ